MKRKPSEKKSRRCRARIRYSGSRGSGTPVVLPESSSRNYEVFGGEGKEKRTFEYLHASEQAYIDYMRPFCVALARVRKAPMRLANEMRTLPHWRRM